MSDSLLGFIFDNRYEINELLGTGAWSNVYRATDLNLGTAVAIKVFMVVAHDGHEVSERTGLIDDGGAQCHMGHHDGPLCRIEFSWFAQDGIGNANLAHVV